MRNDLWLTVFYVLANIALVLVLIGSRAAARQKPEPVLDSGVVKILVPGEFRFDAALDSMGQPLLLADIRLPVNFPRPRIDLEPPKEVAQPQPPPTPGEAAKVWYRMPTNEKVIALTFDDGPAGNWRQLLDILDSRGVKATFFLLGNRALDNPAAVRETAARGHEIANHTWSHPRLPDLTLERIRWQISAGAAALESAGVTVQPYFRPPYGSRDNRVDQAAMKLGYHTIMWNVDTRDWELKDPEAVLARALAGLKPGAIVLFHDGPATTPQILGRFIDEVLAQGYKVVLISQYIP